MKAKLTLSILATLALLLFCVVVTVNSPRGQALPNDWIGVLRGTVSP